MHGVELALQRSNYTLDRKISQLSPAALQQLQPPGSHQVKGCPVRSGVKGGGMAVAVAVAELPLSRDVWLEKRTTCLLVHHVIVEV